MSLSYGIVPLKDHLLSLIKNNNTEGIVDLYLESNVPNVLIGVFFIPGDMWIKVLMTFTTKILTLPSIPMLLLRGIIPLYDNGNVWTENDSLFISHPDPLAMVNSFIKQIISITRSNEDFRFYVEDWFLDDIRVWLLPYTDNENNKRLLLEILNHADAFNAPTMDMSFPVNVIIDDQRIFPISKYELFGEEYKKITFAVYIIVNYNNYNIPFFRYFLNIDVMFQRISDNIIADQLLIFHDAIIQTRTKRHSKFIVKLFAYSIRFHKIDLIVQFLGEKFIASTKQLIFLSNVQSFISTMIKSNVTLYRKKGKSFNLLHIVCSSNYNAIDYIDDVIAMGIDINSRDKQNNTPLMRLSNNVDDSIFDVFSVLIEKGADIYSVDHKGRNMLHRICYYPHYNLRVLIGLLTIMKNEGKLDDMINMKDRIGMAPIDNAVISKTLIFILVLRNYGVKINHAFEYDADMLYVLLKGKLPQLYLDKLHYDDEYKNKNKSDVKLQLSTYTMNNISVLKKLPKLQYVNIDITARDNDGRTLLMRNIDSLSIFQLLLEYGSSVNVVDDKGNNILHHMIITNNPEVIDMLDGFTGVFQPNNEGLTPIDLLTRNNQYISFIGMVIRKFNIDANSINSNDRDVLLVLAINGKNISFDQLLLLVPILTPASYIKLQSMNIIDKLVPELTNEDNMIRATIMNEDILLRPADLVIRKLLQVEHYPIISLFIEDVGETTYTRRLLTAHLRALIESRDEDGLVNKEGSIKRYLISNLYVDHNIVELARDLYDQEKTPEMYEILMNLHRNNEK